MFSTDRPSPYDHEPRIVRNEDTLKTAELQVERKTFTLKLKENPRGRFLRITEEAGSKRNSIIIPFTGMKDFRDVITEMAKAAETMPAPKPAADAEEPNDSIGNR